MKNWFIMAISSLVLVLSACSTAAPPTPVASEETSSTTKIRVQASSHTSVQLIFDQIVDESYENAELYSITADGTTLSVFSAELDEDKTKVTLYTEHHASVPYTLSITNDEANELEFFGLSHEHSHDELSTQGAYASQSLWPFPENISVCWRTSGFTTEKDWVKLAITETLEASTTLRFTGWGACTNGEDIPITIADTGPEVQGIGKNISSMTLNFTFKNWNPSAANNRKFSIQAIAVHEFAHAAGMTHEANRIDSPCDRTQGTVGDTNHGAFDTESVMNYCNDWTDKLSDDDKLTLNTMYPPTTWTQDTPGVEGLTEAGDQLGKSMISADFNNDGYLDLAVGAPGEAIGSVSNAGAVHIIYGSPTGLVAEGSKENSLADLFKYVSKDQLLYEDVQSVSGQQRSERDDQYGYSLATGDFDGDGYADLVIGEPFEDIGSKTDAGEVSVLYGSQFGLLQKGQHVWNQDSAGILGVAEANDKFGFALTTGDFNGDGVDDLAVGVPGENSSAGYVNIIYSKRGSGLSSEANQLWAQGRNGIYGAEEAGDGFGTALIAGDLDKDGKDDLVVGVPGEAIGSIQGAGIVNVIHGSSTGLTSARNHAWTQDMLSNDLPETGDGFGSALAIGSDQGAVRLYIGVPFEDIWDYIDAGVVTIASYENGQRTGTGVWNRVGGFKSHAYFGFSLTVADFNQDRNDDVAIGMPQIKNNNLNSSTANGGEVQIRFLGTLSKDVWSQDRGLINSAVSENGDAFGHALTAGDFNADGYPDLVIGVPYEDVGNLSNAGAFHVLSKRHLNP